MERRLLSDTLFALLLYPIGRNLSIITRKKLTSEMDYGMIHFANRVVRLITPRDFREVKIDEKAALRFPQ